MNVSQDISLYYDRKGGYKLRFLRILQVPCQILITFQAWPTSASTCCF